MRKELEKIGSENRHRFSGTVSRFGQKSGYRGLITTICLIDVKDENGNDVADHVWMVYGKNFKNQKLRVGDVISFDARVSDYWKGYMGWRDLEVYKPIELDYKLSYPTKVVNHSKNMETALDESGNPMSTLLRELIQKSQKEKII